MNGPKRSSGRPSALTEVKLLFTAGSLATILLGWGALAAQAKPSQDVDPLEEPPPVVPPSFAFLADPLPTVAVPGRMAGNADVTESGQATALRAVDAPPPVQIITVSKPASGNSSRSGGGRTQSSK